MWHIFRDHKTIRNPKNECRMFRLFYDELDPTAIFKVRRTSVTSLKNTGMFWNDARANLLCDVPQPTLGSLSVTNTSRAECAAGRVGNNLSTITAMTIVFKKKLHHRCSWIKLKTILALFSQRILCNENVRSDHISLATTITPYQLTITP